MIDEFQVGDKTSDYNEYFKIKNYSSSEYPLSGLELRKITEGGTKSLLVTFDKNLGPGESFLVSHAKSIYAADSDYTYSNTSLRADSSVYIYNPNVNPKKIVDLVAFGGYNLGYNEGNSLENPGRGEVYTRLSGADTDDNYADFSLKTVPVLLDPNAGKLLISELVPNPSDGVEWFELYNPTSLDISLENLKICDALGASHCYYFDKSDFMPASSYKTYARAVTKITLNNDGDWLELYDADDNLLADSGGNFGDADKGISLALFGSEYQWTKSLTPAAQNVFTDIVEEEADTASKSKAKTSKSKVKTAAKKTTVVASASDEDPEDLAESASDASTGSTSEVKAAQTTNSQTASSALFNRKNIGWALIGLAILLVVGYICWYFRDYAKEIYHKIRPRDDSARF